MTSKHPVQSPTHTAANRSVQAAPQNGITLNVISNNAQAGDNITVTLIPRDQAVSWSTGAQQNRSSGITLSSGGGGAIPLTSFVITNNTVTFSLTANSSGGSTSFNLHAFLVADAGIKEFELTLMSDQDSQVMAALANQTPQSLSPGGTVFDWSND
jgi:hypothetical protein